MRKSLIAELSVRWQGSDCKVGLHRVRCPACHRLNIARAEICHVYLLPHLSLLDMYHLSRTCSAMQGLVSSAPEECLRKAAAHALPPALVEHSMPVNQLWVALRQQLRLMHHLEHLPEAPTSHDYEWLPSPASTSSSALPMQHGRFHPSRTSLLWPEWVGPSTGEATILVLDLPSLDQRYRLEGPLHEASGARQQSVAVWYEWSPDGSHVAVLWGPIKPELGSGLGELAASALHVYAAGSGMLVSRIQLDLPNFERLGSLMWYGNGTGFYARPAENGNIDTSSVYSIAGQLLSALSVHFVRCSEPRNHEYMALHPPNEGMHIQIVYRMTGKSIAMPVEIQDELGQCAVALDLAWSDNGMYASLVSDDGCRRWFMCFDKGHTVWNKAHAVPRFLTQMKRPSGVFRFCPHGRALAVEVPVAHGDDVKSGRKLLHWRFWGG